MLALAAFALGVLAPSCYPPPLHAAVVDPFRAPACPYCPGNRGIEYAAQPGTPVRALGMGRVTFAGTVAGTRYVVVLGDDEVRITYGMLATSRVSAEQRVRAGDVLGTTTTRFFLGFRVGDDYVDPTPHLGVWRGRPRLVPHDGSPPRPAPATRLVCPG